MAVALEMREAGTDRNDVPIYLGVFSLAAGTVAMAGEAAWTAQLFLLHVAGIALIPLGLAILRAASPKSG